MTFWRILDVVADRCELARGDKAHVRALSMRRPVKFGMVVVQHGITKGGLEPRSAEVLSAASHHLVGAGHDELEVWGSA